jgi:hypothetical protein
MAKVIDEELKKQRYHCLFSLAELICEAGYRCALKSDESKDVVAEGHWIEVKRSQTTVASIGYEGKTIYSDKKLCHIKGVTMTQRKGPTGVRYEVTFSTEPQS